MPDPTRETGVRRWHAVAFGAAAAAVAVLLVLPAVRTESGTIETDGTTTRTESTMTLLESQGAGVLWLLGVPLLLTGIPLLARGRGRRTVALVCTALLAVGIVLSLASIGVFFLPPLAAAVLACARTPSARRLGGV